MLYYSLKSRGLTAWLWLFKNASQAKAAMKPPKWPGLFGPGLAWLTASGRALQSTKPPPPSRLQTRPGGGFMGFLWGFRDSYRVGCHVTTQHPKPPLPPS